MSTDPLPHAYRVLEFDLVRSRVAEHCETEMGHELAERVTPLFNPKGIEELIAETDEASQLMDTDSVPSLGGLRDVREAARRAAKGGTLDGVSLYRIGVSLGVMRSLRTVLRGKSDGLPRLCAMVEELPEAPKTEARLIESLDGDGEVRDEASPALAKARQAKKQAASRMLDRIQSYVSGKTREWLSDAVYTTREGRYVVPVKSEHRAKVRGIVHDSSASGHTVYIEPDDVVQLGNALRQAEGAEKAEIARILDELSSRVGADGEAIAHGVHKCGEIDFIFAKARYGHAVNGCIPKITGGHHLRIVEGRHPLLDPSIAVPLFIHLGDGHDGLLITGPNTGGKTVSIKTVGLFVLMAQCGMMLPAREVDLGPFTQVWADIGDEQSLQQSLSTFSGHIRNIANALQQLVPGGLVLLDEVGAGTDPAEGSALAKAILLSIQESGGKVMASTHYGELKIFAYNTPGFVNAAMEFDLKSLRPSYRLIMGAPGASHALRIAERYGLPKAVLDRARDTAGTQHQEVSAMLERLEEAQKQAQRAQGQYDKIAHRLKQVEAEAERKLAEAKEAKAKARAHAAETIEDTLRELRLEANEIFETLKKDRRPEAFDQARSKLKRLQERGGSSAKGLKPEPMLEKAAAEVHKGDRVKITGHTQVGTVLAEPRDGKVQVQMGMIKMSFPASQVERADAEVAVPKAVYRENLGLKKVQSASIELVMIKMRAEEAQEVLDRFLDDSILAGLPNVRLVHGKGEGILRKITHETLRRHRGVRSFREAEPNEGGAGVTIAVLT